MDEHVAYSHRLTTPGDSRVPRAARSRKGRSDLGALHVVALVIAVGAGVVAAPPAGADEAGYLERLQSRLAYLTTQQLLTEGYKICQLTHGGRPSSDAIPMVTKDLAISVPAAIDIIVAAGGELGC
ncbi:hypothetical protein [Mycobacterium sp. NPDC006124]|uniref:hypothetical protein n=1 Tax=Mycobacterium sp. NPDC006124 TaxID=3156729 RepID=UPI0033A9BE8D